jgi:hypothetical protein
VGEKIPHNNTGSSMYCLVFSAVSIGLTANYTVIATTQILSRPDSGGSGHGKVACSTYLPYADSTALYAEVPLPETREKRALIVTRLEVQLVEALCYKPVGCGFVSRCHWIFELT